jgi:hypothetical protein
MAALHITKIAFGCDDIGVLRDRIEARATGGETFHVTRYRPTRHEEVVGGSLFWIIKHQLVARQRILGFEEQDGRCRIRLDAELVPVRPRPRRAHQGWRYLKGEEAPVDLDADEADTDAMPLPLVSELAALGLI